MKRFYIAIALILFSVAVGIFELIDVGKRTTKCMNNIQKIDELVSDKKYNKSAKICKTTAEEFENTSAGIMYSYYNHEELEKINSNLYCMYEYLKHKDGDEYFMLSTSTKRLLKAIKEKEPLILQNIL